MATTHQKVIEELTQTQVNMGVIQKVLQSLLREQVSIRDLVTILEAIADASSSVRDPEVITEFVRQRMARSILKPYLSEGVLNIMILEKSLEEKLIASLQTSDPGNVFGPRSHLQPAAHRKNRRRGKESHGPEPAAHNPRPTRCSEGG